MAWLLKIVEGPMKGAEAALVSGMRVKVGSGDACDIIIADSSLGEIAFELDVSDAAVTLIGPGGVTEVMNSFEVHPFGQSAFAVGPAEGRWEALRPVSAPAAEERGESAAERAPDEGADAGGETSSAADAVEKPPRRRRVGCFAVLVILLLLVLAFGAALWYYWSGGHLDRDADSVAQAENCRVCRHFGRDFCDRVVDWRDRVAAWFERDAPVPKITAAMNHRAALEELIAANALDLRETNGTLTVAGNLPRRGERLAIRALTLAVDRYAQFDLSDDESFTGCADALLFTVTEGCVKTAVATNRVIELAGYAPHETALRRVEAALRADVPWVSKVRWPLVTVGGPAPAAVANTVFARTGELAGRGESAADSDAGASGASGAAARRSNLLAGGGAAGGGSGSGAAAIAALVSGRRTGAPSFAGVLTKPYPCIVLGDGHRLLEGAKVGSATIIKIEAEKLTLEEGGKILEVAL